MAHGSVKKQKFVSRGKKRNPQRAEKLGWRVKNQTRVGVKWAEGKRRVFALRAAGPTTSQLGWEWLAGRP